MSEWKETDFGNVPENWEISTLGQICDVLTDGSHSSPRPVTSTYFMASVKDMRYNYFDFSDCKTISKKDFETLEIGNCSPLKGDILLSKDGANCLDLIFVYKQSEKIVLLSSIAIARLKKGFDPDFYRYFLLSPNVQFLMRNNFVTGSAIPRVVLKDFRNVPVPIISFIEQRAIASVLSSLDDKIDLLHRQNQTLEKMAETLFRQWFVKEAKEEWKDGTLGEAIEIYDNLRKPLSKMERDKKKDGHLYPYYGAAQIMDYINDYIFDGEYILLGEDGTVRTEEGFPILQYATGKFWVNNHTHVIKAKEPYNNFFIWNYLSKKNIDEIVTGAVQPKINQGNLKSLDFPQFPMELVDKFNQITESIFKKINQNKTQIRTLSTLRDTLLPKLMSGEVRVEV
jgi:type I restriction enzyme S subunit